MRDDLASFTALDTVPFGVNGASAESHAKFMAEQSLNFDLLVDDGLHVARAYDALRESGATINRTVVIIGKNGRVLFWAHGSPPVKDLLAAIEAAEDE